MKKILMYGFIALFLLAGCAQTSFVIDDNVFTQENMAHAATLGTIYATSATTTGDHECDDTPSGCCAAGYHLCDINEVKYGGREIEFSGTGRNTTPYNAVADSAIYSVAAATDCTGWSYEGKGFDYRTTCSYTTTIACVQTNNCNANYAQWCCSR